MDGLVAGLSNKVIAREYDISPRTIEVYRANVMTKMQAGSLSELVRLAMRGRRAQGLSQIKLAPAHKRYLMQHASTFNFSPARESADASSPPKPVIYVVDDDHRRARLAAVSAGNRRLQRPDLSQRRGAAGCGARQTTSIAS